MSRGCGLTVWLVSGDLAEQVGQEGDPFNNQLRIMFPSLLIIPLTEKRINACNTALVLHAGFEILKMYPTQNLI